MRYKYRFRFPVNVDRQIPDILAEIAEEPDFSGECHKSTKLVTSPPSTADPLDPHDWLDCDLMVNDMATAPPPPDFRKPPSENGDYFFVHSLDVDDERFHIKRNRGNGTALCGKAVIWGEYMESVDLLEETEFCEECSELREYNQSLRQPPPLQNAVPVPPRYRGGCPRCGSYKWAFRLGLPGGGTEISCMVCAEAGFETRGLKLEEEKPLAWHWMCTIDPRKDKLFWEGKE